MEKIIKELIHRGNAVTIRRINDMYQFKVNGEVVACSIEWSNFESVILNYILEDAGL